MAKRSVRGVKPVPAAGLAHPCNSEVREATGLDRNPVASLATRDVRELAATYLLDGLDGLQAKFGLTRGEMVDLVNHPEFNSVVVSVAEAQRVQVCTKGSFTLSRLLARVEQLAMQDDATVGSVLATLDEVKKLLIEVGGIEQRFAIRHAYDQQPGSRPPVDQHGHPVMMPNELAKLQRLQQQLTALGHAGVDMAEGVTATSEELPDEHRKGLRGTG